MEKQNKNVELIICPVCKGTGEKEIFNGDNNDKETCLFCNGKRVVKQITTVEYADCDDK